MHRTNGDNIIMLHGYNGDNVCKKTSDQKREMEGQHRIG